MAKFVEAIAVEGSDGRYAVNLDPEWTVSGNPHGGYLLALLANAAIAADAASATPPTGPAPTRIRLSASAVYMTPPTGRAGDRRGRAPAPGQDREPAARPPGPGRRRAGGGPVHARPTRRARRPDLGRRAAAGGRGHRGVPAQPDRPARGRRAGRDAGHGRAAARPGLVPSPGPAGRQLRGHDRRLGRDTRVVALRRRHAVRPGGPALRGRLVPAGHLHAGQRRLGAHPGADGVRAGRAGARARCGYGSGCGRLSAPVVDQVCEVWDSADRIVAQATQLALVRLRPA